MATTDPSAGDATDERFDSGVGMAHLTVVPANFDPNTGNGRKE
ncbi:hypothetical protein ACLI4Z_13400 [Natrialbaceae archaeon A-arb3/5]